jgi:hypothetical protein
MLRDASTATNMWRGSRDLVTPASSAVKAKLSLLAVAGVLAGAGAVWLAAHQPAGRPTEPGPVLTLLVGASLLGCGVASWRARPENRVGPIMIFTGFAWFTALLVDATPPWLNTIGLAVQSVWVVGLVYLLLAFPSGRLPGRLDRWLVGGGLVAGVGLQLLAMLYGNKAGLRCPGCANNLLQVVHDNHKAQGWLGLQRLIGAVLIVTVIVLLIRRWLRASAAQRHAVWPVLAAGDRHARRAWLDGRV